MHIQINTDKNIDGSDAFADQMKVIVESTLNRFVEHITRVEVHLSDENSDKAGINDKRCLMEARLEGRQPIAVTHQAANLDLAVQGAAGKLKNMIESTLGRLSNR
jgi:ribosome-associated translation inhibitor RaiA